MSCLANECHAEVAEGDYVHLPVVQGQCDVCHAWSEGDHPGNGGSMQMVATEPELCLRCHEDPAKGKAFKHSAVENSCTGCHEPHSGRSPVFVRESGGKLCLTCHDKVMDDRPVSVDGVQIFGIAVGPTDLFGHVDQTGIVAEMDDSANCTSEAKYVHGPVSAGSCHLCHEVHGSENFALLNLPGNKVCTVCHVGIQRIVDDAVSQHEPVVNGRCWDCHTPHASNFKPYLKAYYPQEFYVSYERDSFDLCFKCHDERAFIYERTSEATAFRNRDHNLHYFHVNRSEKGRVCKACHGVHGAEQDHLLRRYVSGFGDWDIPLIWVSKEERATCYVGCHKPKTYDRNRKIYNP